MLYEGTINLFTGIYILLLSPILSFYESSLAMAYPDSLLQGIRNKQKWETFIVVYIVLYRNVVGFKRYM